MRPLLNTKNNYIIISALLLVLFFVTTNRYTFDQALTLGFPDAFSYYSISKIFSNFYDLSGLPSHHLERWMIFLFLGKISSLLSVDIWLIYRLFVVFLMLLTVILFMYFKKLNTYNSIASLILLFCNPYLFKMYYAVPSELSDALFVFGLILFVLGLNPVKHSFLISGVLICCISKQTSIMLIPILTLLYINSRKDFIYIYLCCTILIFWVINSQLTLNYFGGINNNYLEYHSLGLYKFIFFEFDWIILLRFCGRLSVFVLTLAPIIILVNRHLRHDFKWILFFMIIGFQPIFGGGPLVTGNNIQRLLAIGTPLLLPILWKYRFTRKSFLSFFGIYILISFHHKFSFLFYLNASKFHYLVILILSALFVLIFWNSKMTKNNKAIL